MFPEGTRSPDGAIHEFKSGAGYLALRSGCDVLPVLIRGTHDVLGKGSLIPRRHPVEVRIGRVITNAELRALAENAEGTGAYRKLADPMRAAVLALGERMPPPARPNAPDASMLRTATMAAQRQSWRKRPSRLERQPTSSRAPRIGSAALRRVAAAARRAERRANTACRRPVERRDFPL